jgi:hypothetical protein
VARTGRRGKEGEAKMGKCQERRVWVWEWCISCAFEGDALLLTFHSGPLGGGSLLDQRREQAQPGEVQLGVLPLVVAVRDEELDIL